MRGGAERGLYARKFVGMDRGLVGVHKGVGDVRDLWRPIESIRSLLGRVTMVQPCYQLVLHISTSARLQLAFRAP